MAEYVGGKEKLVNVDEPIPNISIFEKRLFGRADNIIPLEDMKKIMKESIDNAKTYGDFLNGMIIGAYELGIEHGKAACQETIDALEKELPKNELKPCPFCGNEVNVEKIPLWYGNGRGYSGCYEFKIKCDNCGCTVDQPMNDSIYRSEEKARENAIKAWNRRAKNEN